MKTSEKKLLAAFNRLDTSAQDTLLAFAEFLLSRNADENHSSVPVQEPRTIHRPDNESVVAAIKRLSASYPMLDKPQLLNESSAIMTRHVMQGVKAEVAIDELEALFSRFYEELLEQSTSN